jgi:hypothetical protein
MANVKIKLNRAGVRTLLRGSEMQAILRRSAGGIAGAAGPGHEVHVSAGRNRARAEVVTKTIDAMLAEAKNRNLTRAVDSGR